MKIPALLIFLLVIISCILEVAEAKKSKGGKKGINKIFKKPKKNNKKKVASSVPPSPSQTSAASVPNSSNVEVRKSKITENIPTRTPIINPRTITSKVKPTISTVIKSKLSSIMTPTAKPKASRLFNKKANLKMVYKSVLPMGLDRPENNVVFEFTDNEEGKTCMCVCRIR